MSLPVRTLSFCLRHPRTQWWLMLAMVFLGLWGVFILRGSGSFPWVGTSGLISLGVIGSWRWGWWLIQMVRSRIYLYWVFPRWRRQADRVPLQDLPPVCLLVPTYQEKDWITERVFMAIAQEAQTLAQPLTLLVTSSSDTENAHIRSVLQRIDPQLQSIRLIEMVQTGEGKRKAMADGLRRLAQLNLPPDTVVALMDGDSELTPGTLRRSLPFFRLFPRMGALTTDELPIVQGSYLFSEWFHLRLSQRHYQMSSVSLSRKVMCLTGRFSLFRVEAALCPSFANQLELDTLDDWLWGRFKFLSGDDKSTWYWLLQRGYDMLYIPDVVVYSIETISGSLLDRAYQNMRCWYGNMLRNSDRAIALGPDKSGWFMWYCLIDQRLSFWTSLITPSSLLLCLLQGRWLLAGIIVAWILFSRSVMLLLIFSGRTSHIKLIHFPIFLLSQWSSCLVKIWTQMNLAQQKWTNRGNQSISAAGEGWVRWSKLGASRFLYLSQLFGFGITLCWLSSVLHPVNDTADLWWHYQAVARPAPVDVIRAVDYGVIASDRQDDAAALQALIDGLPVEGKIQIDLPIGEIDLFQPIQINRSHLVLKGQGSRRTVLQAHVNQFASGAAANAVISIRPALQEAAVNPVVTAVAAEERWVEAVEVQGVTIRQVPAPAEDAVNGLVLERARQIGLTQLSIESGYSPGLVLTHTADVRIQYAEVENLGDRPPILFDQDVNTQIEGLILPARLELARDGHRLQLPAADANRL